MFAPNVQLYYKIQVHDQAGKLVRKGRVLKAHSFCTAFMGMERSLSAPSSTNVVKDTGGINQALGSPQPIRRELVAASGVVTHGIRLGTGTTAVTMADHKLATEIAEGTGSGQLSHGESTVSVITETATESSINAIRVMTNSSGGTITLGELGVYVRCPNNVGISKFFMTIRDVLSVTVPVLNTEVVTVVYTIKIVT